MPDVEPLQVTMIQNIVNLTTDVLKFLIVKIKTITDRHMSAISALSKNFCNNSVQNVENVSGLKNNVAITMK